MQLAPLILQSKKSAEIKLPRAFLLQSSSTDRRDILTLLNYGLLKDTSAIRKERPAVSRG